MIWFLVIIFLVIAMVGSYALMAAAGHREEITEKLKPHQTAEQSEQKNDNVS